MGALAPCSGLLVAAVYLPGVAEVLKAVEPGVRGWALVIGMSLIPWVVGEVVKQKDHLSSIKPRFQYTDLPERR